MLIQLLQTPRLTLADGRVHALERKDAALLALIAIDGAIAPARSAALLWPGSPPAQARANLRQRLFRLRKLAGREVVEAAGALTIARGIGIDVLTIDEALDRDPNAGAGELLGALDYGDTGELADWVDTARQRWRDRLFERLAARASALEANDRIAAALVLAQRMVADDPTHEHNHRRVMRLHYVRGDRGAAMAAYQTCRDRLRTELGTQPDRETDALATLVDASGTLPKPAVAPRLVATLRPPRLCGREGPWGELEQTLARGACARIEGEAGIGKSRLLCDFAAAHGDAPVFGARPGDAGLPYALLARIVRGLLERWGPPRTAWVLPELARIAPEIGTQAPGQLVALRLQQAMVQALTDWRDAGLHLLIVDDLHYADAATLELLPALVAGVCAAPIVWLFGVRAIELVPTAAAWFDADDTQAPERVALGPLDHDGVAALLASLAMPELDVPHWAPVLLKHTGGNPLFVLETLIAMQQRPDGGLDPGDKMSPLPTPERIGRLIERRLSQLTPVALKLVRVAAIAGPDFSAGLAVRVLGLDHMLDIADSWAELEAAQVIRDDAFAHDLVHQGALRAIPQAIARGLHGAVAAVLATAEAPPARLAAHWAAAEEWAKAGVAYEAAAVSARRASRRVEEGQLYDEAVRCFERCGRSKQAFEARRDSISTLLATRLPAEVLPHTEGLLADARDDAMQMDALAAHARTLWLAGRRADAVVVSDKHFQLATSVGGPAQRFEAACGNALCLSPGPRANEAIERLRAFGTWVRDEGAKRRAEYHSALTMALHHANRLSEAAAEYPCAIAVAQELGDTAAELSGISNLGSLLTALGRYSESRERAEHACRMLERIGAPDSGIFAAAAHSNLGHASLMLGHWDRALSSLEAAWQHAGSGGGTAVHATIESHLALLWVHLGQPARARQVARPIGPGISAQRPDVAARRCTVQARIDAVVGISAAARLREALELFERGSAPHLRLLAELDAARIADPAEAIASCERLARNAEALEHRATAMRARLLRVESLMRAGDRSAAAAAAEELVERIHDCRPADTYFAEALWILSEALRRGGEVAAGAAVLAGAADWIRSTAQDHLAPVFHEAFLQRHPINRAILAACR